MAKNPKQDKAYRFFISKGYSPSAASGIVGNLDYESGLDTSIEGDKGYKGGSSYGIAQFRGERLQRLKKMYGENWTDFDNQLNFVDWELNNTHKKARNILKSAKDFHVAGQAFSDYYEIPQKKYAENKNRRDRVELIHRRFANQDNYYAQEESEPQAVQQNPEMDIQVPDYVKQIEEQNNRNLRYFAEQEEKLKFAESELDKKTAQLDEKIQERNFINDLLKATNVQYNEEQPTQEFQKGGIQGRYYENGGDTKPPLSEFKKKRFLRKEEVPQVAPESTAVNYNYRIPETPKVQEYILSDMDALYPGLKDENMGTMVGDNFVTRSNVLDEVIIKARPKKLKIEDVDLSNVEQKSTDEIFELQKILQKEGYLENKQTKSEPKTRAEILKTQRELVNKGFDIGRYGENKDGVDGVFGEKSRKAFNVMNQSLSGVDGKLGNQTKDALRRYKADQINKNLNEESIDERFFEIKNDTDIIAYQENLSKQGYFKGINTKEAKTEDLEKRTVDDDFFTSSDKNCTDKRCTFFVGQEIEKKIKSAGRERLDAYGDAWTISERLLNQGASEVYSIFDKDKPELSNNQIESYLKSRVGSSEELDVSKVKSGDVVNLFYEGSKFKNQAYKEGNKYFTSHAGIIKKDSKGKLVVEHNVGGKIFRDDLSKLAKKQGKNQAGNMLAIAAIIRPEYNLPKKSTFYDTKEAKVNEMNVSNFKAIGSEESALFTQTLIKNKNELRKDIPVNEEEFNNLVKASRSIAWKESGNNPKVDESSLKKIGAKAREVIGGREMSRGLTQLKDTENLTENLRGKYIKDNGSNLSNPTQSAVPTFYALSSRYLYLRDLAKKENLSVSSDELSKLAMLSWNEPITLVSKSLKKYKTFDNTMKAYRGEEGKHNYDLAMEAFDKYLK
jgi:hypothetical protein